jgi:Rieske 2Fe-2S family protein
MTTFRRTVSTYKHGAHTMPGEYYTSPAIFAEENEHLFPRSWHCVGRSSALANAGDYVLRTVAGESLIILRDRGGELRAFFNVCRHRGTRLCEAAKGQFSETIQCPYHAWTYTIDGRLIGAPQMQDVPGFDKREFPLHSAALAEWEGFVFVNVADRPRAVCGGLRLHARAPNAVRSRATDGRPLGHVRGRGELEAGLPELLGVPALPMIHPELTAVLPYQSGANDLTEGPFLGGYMEIMDHADSATMSWTRVCAVLTPTCRSDDRRRAYYYSLMPNMLLSIHPDYAELLRRDAARGGPDARGVGVDVQSSTARRMRRSIRTTRSASGM